MGERIRILFIGEAITLSHLARPAVLAGTLDPARYDVTLASDERLLRLLHDADRFRVVPIRSRVADKSLEKISLFQDSLFDAPTLEAYIREDLALFDLARPDVVVGDMRQSLIVSTQLRRVPFVNIMNAYWHPDAAAKYESPVNPLGRFVGEPAGTLAFNLVVNSAAWLSTLVVNAACFRYGVRPPGFDANRVLSAGDYLAFPDIPDWSGLARVPANAAFVGPCTWAPAVPEPPWWGRVPTDRSVIYVGLGSSGQPRLLEMIVRAVADLPVTVVVSTAARTTIPAPPPNVFVADYLNGAAVARLARLAVTNGGSTAGPQALLEGCPVLGVTSNIDQMAFMRRVEQCGAGELITETDVTEARFRGLAVQMLRDEKYARAARRLSDSIRRLDTAAAFNGLLDRVLAARPAAHHVRNGSPVPPPPNPPARTAPSPSPNGPGHGSGARHRILFIGEAVTLAHMARPAVLAEMLDPDRFETYLACDDRHFSLLRAPHPFRLIPLRSRLAGRTTQDHLEVRAVFLFDPATIEEYIREDLEILERVRPAVVVSDLRLTMAISARLAGVPLVTVMNAHFSPTSDIPWELPNTPPGGPGLGEIVWTLFRPAYDVVQSLPLNMACARHGLPALGADLRGVLCCGDVNLYPDLPELCPLRAVPPNHHYVGPLLWSPEVPLPDWWARLPADRPVVYANLGSSGNPALIDAVARGLADLPVSVALATAGRGGRAGLPANVFVADYLPGSVAARRAAVTVCNGGSMPAQQSLAEGTPVLGLAGNSDQAMFMTYVRGYGAGEGIHEKDVSPETVRAGVTRLIRDPRHALAARRVREATAAFDGPGAFRAVIDKLTSATGPGAAAHQPGASARRNGRKT